MYSRVLAAALLLATPSLALADDEEAEIIVTGARIAPPTGSKTGSDPRDVPAAIVVIPGEVLKDQGALTLDAALANASAVAPQFAGGYGLADNYNIRGLAMRFLRDGLPDGPTFVGYRRTLADVASIEVLKGPGSALYGRSEAGGTVNLTTRTPDRQAAFDGAASFGRFDSFVVTGDATAPMGDVFAVRLIGNYERTDGYRGLSRRYLDVLPTVSATLGDNNLTLDYDYRDQRSVVDNYGIPFTTARRLAAVGRRSRFYSRFNRVDQRIDRFTLADEAQVHPNVRLRTALVYDTRDVAITRNAGGNAINAAGVMTGRNGRTQADDADYWTGQFEAVLTPRTGAVAHTVLLGAEYARADIETVRRNYNLPNLAIAGGVAFAADPAIGATTLAFDRRVRADTLSVYGQEQADFGALKVRAGVRYDGVKLTDDGIAGTTARRIAGSPGLVSWQAGAVYAPATWISVYGGYARGKFVAVQTESTSLSPVPESSSQIEAGIKAEPIAGKLSVNAAIFETRRDDFFVTLVPGGDPVQVGRQRSRGAELDVQGEPLPGLGIIANLAYVDAVNRSNALASVTGIAVNQPVFGKRLSSTPKWSGSFWANYRIPAVKGLRVGGGATFKSASFADSLELLRVPGYTVLRAALGYELGPFDAQLTVSNLTGARWFSVPTFIGALPGEPRSAQLTLRAHF